VRAAHRSIERVNYETHGSAIWANGEPQNGGPVATNQRHLPSMDDSLGATQ